MKTPEALSPGDVTFREKAAPTPKFDGLALPSALRELRSGVRNTPRPSEMTALANRVRKIRLDYSPDEENSSDPLIKDDVKPSKLDFSNTILVTKDKENIVDEIQTSENSRKDQIADENCLPVEHKSETNILENSSSAAPVDPKEEQLEEPIINQDTNVQTGNSTLHSDADAVVNKDESEQLASSEQKSDTLDEKDPAMDGFNLPGQQDSDIAHDSNDQQEVEFSVDLPPNETTEERFSEPAPKLETSAFNRSLNILMEGSTKWNWHDRTQATETVSAHIKKGLSEDNRNQLRTILHILSLKLDNQLDELRPSIIVATLALIDSIITAGISIDSKFASDILPSAMDLACGRSLTAGEAAKTVALVVTHFPSLNSQLKDVDNPSQLLKVFDEHSKSEEFSAETRERAEKAHRSLLQIVSGDVPSEVQSSAGTNQVATKNDIPKSPASSLKRSHTKKSPENHITKSATNSTSEGGFRSGTPTKFRNSPAVLASRRALRASWSARLGTPTSSLRTGSEALRATQEFPNEENSGQIPESEEKLVDNSKFMDGNGKCSQCARQGRMYSEDEVAEVRLKTTTEITRSSTLQFEKERQRLQKENKKLCKELEKRKTANDELMSVMNEYELTLKRMVSQENASMNSKQLGMETENTKLKAELLEASDAFENLKEKYELAKQTLSASEKKEQRYIEQIKEMKESMIALQKWSNDLKANSEKKLAKAFENVTSYRASFLDKQAYAEKAISDLKRVEEELSKTRTELSEATVSLKTVQQQLHVEQDARASADTQLSSAKSSVTRLTTQRDSLTEELKSRQEEILGMKPRLEKAEADAARVPDIQRKLDSISAEEQQLKARAYDDMLRIRELEEALVVKENEYEEIQSICEEAMTRLEELKSGNLNPTEDSS